MPTSEERLRVLQLIQDGKISAEEGIRLLESLDSASQAAAGKPAGTSQVTGRGARWFRVRVTDTSTGKTRVNVRLPVNVLSAGMKMGARFSPEVEGLDMNQLMELIQAGATGQVLDVIDEQDGERVEVFLE
ncbi:hypothetical protein LARV_03409 [Longilinea arvoryzae]|uniref:YvlB/LiaX N-terminal domain-containing protein n=1 Tax=Longilinea arvoryzae TaxID=360412 RepID=A0A0S7BNS5_9CHLR|nr:hypothetical protein [Longilinea arvoryzae]GAP15617.1 hypothetical protein LARV_03409 [Longilinea arvoryzae]